jgi:hypothetical protein
VISSFPPYLVVPVDVISGIFATLFVMSDLRSLPLVADAVSIVSVTAWEQWSVCCL